MPLRRLVALPTPLLAGIFVVMLAGLAPACSKGSGATSETSLANGRVSVYVTGKVMPVGMLVATAKQTNVISLKDLPADVAGSDAVTDTAGLECLVAGQSLPAGTVVRRNQLVTPESIGLDRGLTGGTGPRPAGC